MANAVKEEAEELICPLIDARRMEVFTAVYNKQLDEIISPLALVIDEKSFDEELKEHRILFCGNGLKKTEPIIKSINALFTETGFDSRDMVSLSEALFNKREFLDLAYSEPIYLKEFYTKSK